MKIAMNLLINTVLVLRLRLYHALPECNDLFWLNNLGFIWNIWWRKTIWNKCICLTCCVIVINILQIFSWIYHFMIVIEMSPILEMFRGRSRGQDHGEQETRRHHWSLRWWPHHKHRVQVSFSNILALVLEFGFRLMIIRSESPKTINSLEKQCAFNICYVTSCFTNSPINDKEKHQILNWTSPLEKYLDAE